MLRTNTEKGHEGEHEFDQWRVAIDAYKQMTDFLGLTPSGMRFTEASRDAIRRDLRRLAKGVGQMNAGQDKYATKNSVSFDEVPHIMARLSAALMLMELSGALDRVAVDDEGRDGE